jgi:hypothetical protein
MSGNSFAVVFNGRIVEGAAVEQVKGNVAKLFKVEVAKVERLFSGARVVIKKGLDEATAKKYQMALAKAGALCEVIDTEAAAKPPQAEAVPAPQAAVAQPAAATATAAPTAPEIQSAPDAEPDRPGLSKTVVKRAPADLGDLDGVTVEQPGAVIVEHQEIAPPQVDVSGLSMDAPGVTLSEPEQVSPPQLNLSGISMAEVGADIGEAEPAEELEVDISGLSMDEPGATLVEHEEVPAPEIDTSDLSMR